MTNIVRSFHTNHENNKFFQQTLQVTLLYKPLMYKSKHSDPTFFGDEIYLVPSIGTKISSKIKNQH